MMNCEELDREIKQRTMIFTADFVPYDDAKNFGQLNMRECNDDEE